MLCQSHSRDAFLHALEIEALIVTCCWALIKLKVLFFGSVRKTGTRLVQLLDVPETGKYFLGIVALGYKWDTVL